MSDWCITSDFQLDGFVLLKAFVESSELEELQSLLTSALTSPNDEACTRPHNTLLPLRWSDATVGFLLGSERRVQALTDALHADDLKWISGYVSIKEPHSPPLWWHQDWWCWDHPATYQPTAPQIALLCYLGDTTAESGALRLLPGSHLKSTPIHAVLPEAHGVAAEQLDLEHAAFRDLPGQVTLGLRAGEAVVIDYRLLHGTHGNRCESPRLHSPLLHALLEDSAHRNQGSPDFSSGAAIRERRTNLAPALRRLLPSFGGMRRDLLLNRNAPSNFEVVG